MARNFLIAKFDEYEANEKWNSVFRRMGGETSEQERDLKLVFKIAHSLPNVEKNRYRDVAPYDSNRLCLRNLRQDQTDYINASPVAIPGTERRYILSQGPTAETCNDHWQMCWENECTGIIMLNKVIEKGSLKCEPYYPMEGNEKIDFETFRVELIEEIENENYVVRKIRLVNKETDESREIVHMQYTEWPDFGVPESTEHFLEFLADCRSRNLLSSQPSDPPAIVHCSAGIGRSGTFIVVDGVLNMIESGSSSERIIDLESLVVELRKSRVGLIQTAAQFRFCWHSIVDRLRQMDKAKKENEEKEKIQERSEEQNEVNNKKSMEAPAAPIVSGREKDEPSSHSNSKRKTEEEELDERTTKRRSLVNQMVEKSRNSERARKARMPGAAAIDAFCANFGPDGKKYLTAGVVAVGAVLVVYMTKYKS